MWNLLEFVTPLSDTVFDKLLQMEPILSGAAIKDQVKEITNRVPGELVNMAAQIHREVVTAGQQSAVIDLGTVTDKDVLSQMRVFQEQRHQAFYEKAYSYFRVLDSFQQHSHRHALTDMFLPRKKGGLSGFDYQFDDLGLTYRVKIRGRREYRPLCLAAKDALLDIYKSMSLPRNILTAISTGHPTDDQFEDALFTSLVRFSETILKTTDLAGNEKTSIVIRSNSVKVLENPPSVVGENVLLRCSEGYPRFDYINGRTFIQVSVSDFTAHNVGTANIEKALELSTARPTNSSDYRNQIEYYLEHAFGGQHKASIDQKARKFIVTRTDTIHNDGQQVENTRPVEDFRIVYIHRKCGKPNHTGKVMEFPNVLHVSLDQPQALFGDLSSPQGL
ncbi:hypothetical protein BGX34_000775 [Mortierella sp. NVP85]|nr:hypothetical protein BGX34_000775 [Mortierella sp. NVP85]